MEFKTHSLDPQPNPEILELSILVGAEVLAVGWGSKAPTQHHLRGDEGLGESRRVSGPSPLRADGRPLPSSAATAPAVAGLHPSLGAGHLTHIWGRVLPFPGTSGC